jgi:hypothetical protein
MACPCSRSVLRLQRAVLRSRTSAMVHSTVPSTGQRLLLRTRHAKLERTSHLSTSVRSLPKSLRTWLRLTCLDSRLTTLTEKPVLNIPEQEVEFENLGTTIEVIVNGTTTVAGADFQLVQFHMHTPSEHHINGEYHPLEVHMVHQGVGKLTCTLHQL